jgi:exo-beta-1,3-glucanase (GH17 family)
MLHSATAVCAMHWYQDTSKVTSSGSSQLITATTGGVLSQYNAAGDCDGTCDIGTGIRAMVSDGHIVVTACIDDTLR